MFMPISAIGDVANIVIGTVRAHETFAAGSTGALTAQDGEMAVISADAEIYVAHGSAPDATLTASTNASTSRYYVPANGYVPVRVAVGDKFDAEAVA